MCNRPKISAPTAEEKEPAPVLLTRQDTRPTGHAADARRRSKVRLDLNNATYGGLMIPGG